MKELNDSNRYRLLRDAKKDPSALLRRPKFWKPAFWPHYHRLCSDTLFDDPVAGLALTKPAPELAAHQADTVDDRLLQRVRKRFYTQAKAIPKGIAA